GLDLDANTADLIGCFSFSNAVTVNRTQPVGGTLAGGPFEFCVGDGVQDTVSGVSLSGNVGANSQFVVTDTNGVILGLPPSAEAVDFDGAGEGVCLIWHLSYGTGLEGLELENNTADLIGCFSFSNAITVVRNEVAGGTLSGGPFEFCVGDGVADTVSGVSLTGDTGPNSQYVVTDTNGVILGLPPTPEAVDFDGAGNGVCLIWHLSYADGLTGLDLDANTADLMGCFSFSNAVTVNRTQPVGGTLAGGPFEFCVGDGMADMVSGVTLSGNVGPNSQYVVTDTLGEILGLPGSPEEVDFDGAGEGVCLIWHLSYADGLTGLEMGGNTAGLVGCFSLSNSLTVNRVTGGACGTAGMAIIVLNEINVEFGVEIKNVGTAAQDISSLWLCQFPSYVQFSDMTITCQGGDLMLDSGEVVAFQAPFSFQASDGELAIYSTNSFGSSSAIVDYVEWGSTGHERSSVAQSAGIWPSGDFVAAFAGSNSISYDGEGDAASDWSEGAASPCADNSIPARQQMDFEVYPNPASSFININMATPHDELVDLEIFDLFGQQVMKYDNMKLDGNAVMDISELRSGQYFIKLRSGATTELRTFMLIK
ncbi:MAG: T9SS type A sorting domain-containing protein, partial [Saprospiraceae bacterium]|nr:T9SS type A sorting domain-containing protein [Saprospiraceae bacterium]